MDNDITRNEDKTVDTRYNILFNESLKCIRNGRLNKYNDTPNIGIKTFGCRMNVCDSEIITSILKTAGYKVVGELPVINGLADKTDALLPDIVILNCCAVREDGMTSALRYCYALLRNDTYIKIIICGCLVKLFNDNFFKEHPAISAIVHPECYNQLPKIIEALYHNECHLICNSDSNDDIYNNIIPQRVSGLPNEAVYIAKGCNMNCSYCIEPFTRGRERYASIDAIMRNIGELLKRDPSVISLVGHVVENYRYNEINFARLLENVAILCKEKTHSNTWVKFLSSHPSMIEDDVIRVMVDHDNIMRVIHLPLQSGSNQVLKRMNRGYTVKDYMSVVERIRNICPGINIVTDWMVGFCGETEKEFDETVKFIEELQPGDINVYRFSMRPHTLAYEKMSDDISMKIKEQRYLQAMDIRKTMRHNYTMSAVGNEVTLKAFDHTSLFPTCFGVYQDFMDLFMRSYCVEIATGDEVRAEVEGDTVLEAFDTTRLASWVAYDFGTTIDATIGESTLKFHNPKSDKIHPFSFKN